MTVMQEPDRERGVFHKESLLVFCLIGPLIGAVGSGALSDTGGMPLIALLVIYVFGSFFAALGWLIFSICFAVLFYFLDRSSVQIDSIPNDVFVVFTGMAFGALGNSFLPLSGCSLRYFFGLETTTCLTRLVFDEWTLWLLPGIACGHISALLLKDRFRITRHSTGHQTE
jgi:hypothetical protein